MRSVVRLKFDILYGYGFTLIFRMCGYGMIEAIFWVLHDVESGKMYVEIED